MGKYKSNRPGKARKGVSIIETCTSIGMLAIIVLGVSAYTHSSSSLARKAELKISAARVATLLCHTWAGSEGDEAFNPVTSLASGLTINNDFGPAEGDIDWPAGFTLLGNYKVTVNDEDYYATLAYKDIEPGLRSLTVIMAWKQVPIKLASYDDSDSFYKIGTYVAY